MRLHEFASADGLRDATGITSDGPCAICGHGAEHPLHVLKDLRLFVVTKAVLESCFEAGIEWRDLAREYESTRAFEQWFAENIYGAKTDEEERDGTTD